MARLQTFPRDITIVGSHAEIQRQIGNAVPSLLAEVLAREIKLQFFGETPSSPKPYLLPKARRTCPAPEAVSGVPEKYTQLIGDHLAHPGTGRGFLYQRSAQNAKQQELPLDSDEAEQAVELYR